MAKYIRENTKKTHKNVNDSQKCEKVLSDWKK